MDADADPQKDSVYSWEDSWEDWNWNTHSFRHCRRVIEEACKLYSVQPPEVRKHNEVSMSYCVPTKHVISLQARSRTKGKGGLNTPTALHEAAHYIVYWRYGERPQDHGPTFLGVYLWLLEQALVAPREALHATAKKKGLKWRELPPSAVGTRLVRPRGVVPARQILGR